jgi:hypothetical protein
MVSTPAGDSPSQLLLSWKTAVLPSFCCTSSLSFHLIEYIARQKGHLFAFNPAVGKRSSVPHHVAAGARVGECVLPSCAN